MTDSLKYPAVPAPGKDIDSLHRTVMALYQAHNAIIGVPSPTGLQMQNAGDTADALVNVYNEIDSLTENALPAEAELLQGILFSADGKWLATSAATVCACAFRAEGVAGGGAPTVSNSFNTASVVDGSSVGEYDVTLSTASYGGHDILNYMVASINITPGEDDGGGLDIVKGAYIKDVVPAAGTFTIQVYDLATAGAGANVRIVADFQDLELDDAIDVILFLTGDQQTEASGF